MIKELIENITAQVCNNGNFIEFVPEGCRFTSETCRGLPLGVIPSKLEGCREYYHGPFVAHKSRSANNCRVLWPLTRRAQLPALAAAPRARAWAGAGAGLRAAWARGAMQGGSAVRWQALSRLKLSGKFLWTLGSHLLKLKILLESSPKYGDWP